MLASPLKSTMLPRLMVLALSLPTALAVCPDQASDLLLWSDPVTWADPQYIDDPGQATI